MYECLHFRICFILAKNARLYFMMKTLINLSCIAVFNVLNNLMKAGAVLL